MALLRLDSFPDYWNGATVSIGRVSAKRAIKLTVSVVDPATDRVVFLKDEVDATFGDDWKFVPYKTNAEGRESWKRAKWVRLEAQLPSNVSEIRPGMELVIARELAACWTASAPFKRASKKGREDRPDQMDQPFTDQAALINHVESLDYDYWEKGNYLTAGVSIPPDPFDNHLRNFSRGDWYLGVCENMKANTEMLFKDSQVAALREMVEKEQLRFWPSKIKTPHRFREYHPRLKDESTALLVMAIRQSLAGPMKDTERFLGKPVAHLVEWNYKNLLYRLNRQYVKDDIKRRDIDIGSI